MKTDSLHFLSLAFSLHEAAAYLCSKTEQERGTLYLLQQTTELALKHILEANGTCGNNGHSLQTLSHRAAACQPALYSAFELSGISPLSLCEKLSGTDALQIGTLPLSTAELEGLILCTAELLELAEGCGGRQ